MFAVAGNRVDVSARGDQQRRGREIAFARGKHQRRQPAARKFFDLLLAVGRDRRAAFEPAAVGGGDKIRSGMDVGAVLDEHFHDVGMAL